MPQKQEYENYLKFIDEALELAKKIPRYFSKFSNHIYCNHQKLAVYILMQKLKLTSRGIVAYLRSNTDARMHLGLFKVPVHTTIIRFYAKIKNIIGLLLDIRKADTVAVDATGFELESKSFYYRNINKQLFPGFMRKTKNFMKLSIAVDADKKEILTYKIRKSRAHDTRDFKYLLKDIKCSNVAADKGYDSRDLRKFVVKKLKARPHIPYRIFSSRPKRGKLIISAPDKKIYNKRPAVENIFFCLKRKYGAVLRNKSNATQQVELISKLITYNLDRKLNYLLLLIQGLHQRLFHKDFYTCPA